MGRELRARDSHSSTSASNKTPKPWEQPTTLPFLHSPFKSLSSKLSKTNLKSDIVPRSLHNTFEDSNQSIGSDDFFNPWHRPNIHTLAPSHSNPSTSTSTSLIPSHSSQPPHHFADMPDSTSDPHLQIILESPHIVFRGLQGQDFQPATMNGELVLNLDERTSFRTVSMVFRGQAILSLPSESSTFRTHSTAIPLFWHDFQFLGSGPSGDEQSHHDHHYHTLNSGRHAWPFSLTLPSTLPASFKTYSGVCTIEYKLKAVATKKGHFERDLKTKKEIKISRMLAEEAMEFNQTLEIENTWPGKIMYSITIPHKAYAAGDRIPISLKFSPLHKGVTLLSIVTAIRENCAIHIKGTHYESRDIAVTKHLFRKKTVVHTVQAEDDIDANRSGYEAVQVNLWQKTLPEQDTSTSGDREVSGNGSAAGSAGQSRSASRRQTPSHSPHLRPTNPLNMSNSIPVDLEVLGSSLPLSSLPISTSIPFSSSNPTPANSRPPSLHNVSLQDNHEDDEMDTSSEIDVVVYLTIPVWATPSHHISPVTVAHKIKWSASIRNPDGHISELRCALPITILAHQHLEEARLAGEGARNLLFGPSGTFMRADFQPTELPAYHDHVRDRLATNLSDGLWSSRSTPISTPFHSPPSSRPPSPTGRRTQSGVSLSAMTGLALDDHTSRSSSGYNTPVNLVDNPMVWRNSEFQSSLGDLHDNAYSYQTGTRTTPGSPSVEMASSVPTHSSWSSLRRSQPTTPDSEHPNGRKGGFFSIQLPKPLRPLTTLKSNSKLISPSGQTEHSDERLRGSRSRDELSSSVPSSSVSAPIAADVEGGDMSAVPSYEVAARGFLAGVVPIESNMGLPTYEDSSRPEDVP